MEAGPGRFELLALTKLRTPPGLRGKHGEHGERGEQQLTDAEAMPPPPSPSASATAAAAAHGRGGQPAGTKASAAAAPPSRSQLHRVRLAWTDGAGVPRVLGPLPAFYLGAALASSVKSVPGCSLARADSERPCICAWSTGKRGSPCVCESRMARTALL